MDKIAYSENNLSYELDKTSLTATIINGRDTFGNAFIPRSVRFCSQDYIITKIGEKSFAANLNIKSINFPDDSELLSINKEAFAYSFLQTLYIPPKLEFFGENWCLNIPTLNTIHISEKNKNFKYLDDQQKIIIGKSDPNVDEFDNLVFVSRDITDIIIPPSIKQISTNSLPQGIITIKFEGKSSLEIIQKGALNFESKLFLQNFVIPSSVKYIGQIGSLPASIFHKIISPENPHFQYIDDSMILGKSDPNKDEFDSLLSARQDIEKIIIPSSVKYIKPYCFNKCQKLKTVEFQPDSKLISIENNSFYFSSIKEIRIPSSCQVIHPTSFPNIKSQLNLIEFPEDSQIKEIPISILNNQIKLNIPKNVEKLISETYSSLNLSNISISPDNHNISFLDENHNIIVGKSNLDSDVFDVILLASSDIHKVFIPSTITRIEDYAFKNCRMLSIIEFANDIQLKSIGNYAFENSNISKIDIPSSVVEISPFCFMNCRRLVEVNISEDSKLEKIGINAFLRTMIRQIFIPSNANEFSFDFNIITTDIQIYYAINNVEISPENQHFKYLDEEKKIIIGKSDKSSNDFDTILFSLKDIKKVNIPSNIKYINKDAFACCTQLTEVTFEKNSQLISIGAFAFSRTGIIELTIPSHVKNIGKACFSHCPNLLKIDFEPNSELTYFNRLLFYKSPIEFLAFPSSLKVLFTNWCSETANLNRLYLPPENKAISFSDDSHQVVIKKSEEDLDIFDELVFACRKCKNVTIPPNIRKIGTNSFSRSQIQRIFIPKSVICIDFDAFYQCNDVLSIEFEKDSNLESIEKGSLNLPLVKSICLPEKIRNFGFGVFNLCIANFALTTRSELTSIEFLSEEIYINSETISKNCVISFPNARRIILSCVCSGTTILFTCSNAEFIHL